ncbi:glycerophosphodiester phosphodiesterase [Clostridium perfringens]|uniref:glycerophosphodiester phosphodiesterase n=1 Tax=Clostridium perfringens TaxID=1502 RepID=UPI002A28E041|nr:glycerophosphodiester phosphodiesterase [Clostridium perfringens]MDM0728167.1 glycerophosphodiester phosphodiesterase [Clostridium perfringens]
MKKILNVAHRGLSGLYPENTMIAFRKAIEADCDGIEMDVHLTRDGVPVVIHDEEVDRTTNGIGYVKDFTYEQLCNLDAGIKFSDEFKGEKIPTLKEFFDFMKDNNKLINIELKNSIIHYEGLEEKVYKEIENYGFEDRVIISSFDHYSIRKCIRLNKNIKTGILYWDCIFEPHNYCKVVGSSALHPEFNSITEEIVRDAHEDFQQVNVYTVNEKKDMEKMIDLNVDMIITNYPNILKEVLESKNK